MSPHTNTMSSPITLCLLILTLCPLALTMCFLILTLCPLTHFPLIDCVSSLISLSTLTDCRKYCLTV